MLGLGVFCATERSYAALFIVCVRVLAFSQITCLRDMDN